MRRGAPQSQYPRHKLAHTLQFVSRPQTGVYASTCGEDTDIGAPAASAAAASTAEFDINAVATGQSSSGDHDTAREGDEDGQSWQEVSRPVLLGLLLHMSLALLYNTRRARLMWRRRKVALVKAPKSPLLKRPSQSRATPVKHWWSGGPSRNPCESDKHELTVLRSCIFFLD